MKGDTDRHLVRIAAGAAQREQAMRDEGEKLGFGYLHPLDVYRFPEQVRFVEVGKKLANEVVEEGVVFLTWREERYAHLAVVALGQRINCSRAICLSHRIAAVRGSRPSGSGKHHQIRKEPARSRYTTNRQEHAM
jgi:hypothetical protein